ARPQTVISPPQKLATISKSSEWNRASGDRDCGSRFGFGQAKSGSRGRSPSRAKCLLVKSFALLFHLGSPNPAKTRGTAYEHLRPPHNHLAAVPDSVGRRRLPHCFCGCHV